jgi:hypothetical protein
MFCGSGSSTDCGCASCSSTVRGGSAWSLAAWSTFICVTPLSGSLDCSICTGCCLSGASRADGLEAQRASACDASTFMRSCRIRSWCCSFMEGGSKRVWRSHCIHDATTVSECVQRGRRHERDMLTSLYCVLRLYLAMRRLRSACSWSLNSQNVLPWRSKPVGVRCSQDMPSRRIEVTTNRRATSCARESASCAIRTTPAELGLVLEALCGGRRWGNFSAPVEGEGDAQNMTLPGLAGGMRALGKPGPPHHNACSISALARTCTTSLCRPAYCPALCNSAL